MTAIEIIPNWHPIFVHFMIGLFSTSAILFVVHKLILNAKWSEMILNAAYVNLWVGAFFTILTISAGWHAYNTVAHDGPSHAAMTSHRNAAIITALIWAVAVIWSVINFAKRKSVNIFFVTLIIVASIMLAITGYKGGEAVYRYGLGVISLPKTEGSGDHHSHNHNSNSFHQEENKNNDNLLIEKTGHTKEHNHHNHQH